MFSKEGERRESEKRKWTGKRAKVGGRENKKKRGRVRGISYATMLMYFKRHSVVQEH